MADRHTKSPAATIPKVVTQTLAGHAEARAVFEQLPLSHQREYVNWITSAKKPETVTRRLEQLVPMLLAKNAKRR